MGGPGSGPKSDYTDAMADKICGRIAEGESLACICKDPDYPNMRTIHKWLDKEEYFRAAYARAREHQGDYMDIRILDVCNKLDQGLIEPDVARVLLSGLQWRAARLKPKTYGDKTVISGDADAPLQVQHVQISADDVARRAAFLLAQAAGKPAIEDQSKP